MLKSSELRIGNWVYLPSKGNDYQIISGYDIEEIESSGDAESITLTSFKLLDFGFLWNGDAGWFEMSGWMPYVIIPFDNLTSGARRYRLTTFKKDWNLCEFEHTHQLQNLYFALTGKELELIATPQHS